jgi:hypothetical protein
MLHVHCPQQQRVWQWKEEYGGKITNQVRTLNFEFYNVYLNSIAAYSLTDLYDVSY